MSARWTEQELAAYRHRRGLGPLAAIDKAIRRSSRPCKHCKVAFIPKKLSARHKGAYCSRRCYQESSRGTQRCEHCGSLFQSPPSAHRRYCSRACTQGGQQGSGNPSWRGGVSKTQVTKTCEVCSATFEVGPYAVGRFCSNECQIAGIAARGESNPNWRGGTFVPCANCGQATWRQPSWSQEKAYCSRRCFATGEFATRDAHRWQSKSRWGMAGTRSGKRPDLGNQFFRSRWEANYARYLNFLASHGVPLRWEYEADTFEFGAIRKGTRFYTPDFKVMEDGKPTEYHEVKGWKHPKGETALKRMARYYPDIKIVIIDAATYKGIAKEVSCLIPNWE